MKYSNWNKLLIRGASMKRDNDVSCISHVNCEGHEFAPNELYPVVAASNSSHWGVIVGIILSEDRTLWIPLFLCLFGLLSQADPPHFYPCNAVLGIYPR